MTARPDRRSHVAAPLADAVIGSANVHDESLPAESADVLPVAFFPTEKENLTYWASPTDHRYRRRFRAGSGATGGPT